MQQIIKGIDKNQNHYIVATFVNDSPYTLPYSTKAMKWVQN